MSPYLKSPWKVTDGGAAADGFVEEDSDCVVRAFALAFEISYRKAFLLCQRLGRVRNRGMYMSEVVHEAAAMCRYKVRLVRRSGTVGQLLSDCELHTVMLAEVSEHVFCIRRLQIHDLRIEPLKTKLLRAYLVQPL